MVLKQLLGAAAVLALSTGVAAAVPATIETDANVRSGPGTRNPVITTLPAGTVVDVGPCTSWCQISFDGGQGYIARSLLALGGSPPAVAVGPAYYDDYYDDYPFYGYAYGPSIGFVHRRHHHRHHGHWGHHGPGRPGWAGRPPVGGNPSGGNPKIGQSVRPGGSFARGGGGSYGGGSSFGGGAKMGGGGGGAVSAPSAAASSGGGGGGGKFR
jgi:uncharacterized protein YraI